VSAASEAWEYSPGVWLPRGAVVTSTLDPAALSDLEGRSLARGVRAFSEPRAQVKRSALETDSLEAFAAWLSTHSLDVLGTVTFRDEYAAAHGLRSLSRALADVERQLRRVTMRKGQRIGFLGRYVLCGEWHPSGRNVPHVHAVFDSCGEPVEAVCSELYHHFYTYCGRSRFEPMRDQTQATLYGLKDTVKSASIENGGLAMRLGRQRRRARRDREGRTFEVVQPAHPGTVTSPRLNS